MNSWLEALKQLGIASVFAGAFVWFLGKQLWPWLKHRSDKIDAALEESHRENRKMAREFAEVMAKANENNREFARQLKVLADKERRKPRGSK
jgi:F0F1-type ATP synthase membrane subunit b/b'